MNHTTLSTIETRMFTYARSLREGSGRVSYETLASRIECWAREIHAACVEPLQTGTDLAGVGLSVDLTPDGRAIVAFLIRLFHLDNNSAEDVRHVVALLKAHEGQD